MKKKSKVVLELDAIQTAIANTLDDAEILGILSQHGYNTAVLNQGTALCSTAMAKANKGVKLRGARKETTLEVRSSRSALQKAVSKFSRVCRTVFRTNEAALVTLGLQGQGPMPAADAEFIDRARVLFNVGELSGAEQAKLTARKYDSSKISQERAKISAFEVARQHATSANGAKQQGTQEKKAAVRAAKVWFSDFRATARTELAEKPQLLETIGIVVVDGRTKAQREGVKKAAVTRATKSAINAQKKKAA